MIIAVYVLIALSVFFALAGVVGILRMPDAFCRMQSSTNIATFGVLGVILGGILYAFFIHESPFYLYNPVKWVMMLFYAICVFCVELTKANLNVAFKALNPSLPINPGIVKVPVDLKSEYGQSMLANSITLTPGTITMDVAEEKGQTYYYIHWIDVETQDNKAAGDAIKGSLEKGVGRIFK